MKAILNDGPYDGTELDHNDINLYTTFWPVGVRQFIIMPPPSDWDAVRQDQKDKSGPFEGSRPIYELIRTGGTIEGRFDCDGNVFSSAIQEHQEGRQKVPVIEFSGQYFGCWLGKLRSFPDDYFMVTDEKDREWLCIWLSKEEGEAGGPRIALSRFEHGGKFVVLLCDHEDELRGRLSDQL